MRPAGTMPLMSSRMLNLVLGDFIRRSAWAMACSSRVDFADKAQETLVQLFALSLSEPSAHLLLTLLFEAAMVVA